MDETLGAQYAIQVAISTLRDRCKNLQHHINVLEEENVDLRIRCSRNEEKSHSVSEIDRLREHIMELTEQKQQLTNKIKLVTNENQELWSKLGKLTRVNKNLGSQLNKITDTLSQYSSNGPPGHTTLIRSKTFTQEEPHTKFLQKNLEENDRISLELEDISLKLTDSFSKQKKELDKLVSEIQEIQFNDDVITEDFGFSYDDEIDSDEFNIVFDELSALREQVLQQRNILRNSVKNLESVITLSKNKKNVTDSSTSTKDIPPINREDKSTETNTFSEVKISPSKVGNKVKEVEKICPICTKIYSKEVDFMIFQQHVEDHFIVDTFEML